MFPYFFYDPTWIIILPALILSIWAQSNVNSTFKKYSQIHNHMGYTGADAAKWEEETRFEMCEENVKRFKAEAALRSIEFVKRIVLPSCKGDENEYLDEYYKNCDAFFRKQISVYKRSKNNEAELFETLEKYTKKLAP